MTPQQLVYKSKSWKDFEKKLSKLQPKERGTAFEWLCVFYLQIEPRYRTTYKRVLHSSEFLKESSIKKILGFTQNKEEGADAIAERYDGKIDIIQCKYLDSTDKNLTKKHIESPLEIAKGNTAKPYVDTILMCSNAKGLTKNEDLRKRHPNIQFRAVLGGDFKELSKEDFNNIRKIIDGSIPEYKSKNPFKHQQRARDSILEHFKKENRGQIVHACGTGKTLTSYFTFRELNPRLTLFAVPSLQLINQTLLEWTKESLADDSPISPFVVCSDKSNEKIGECEPQLWLQELGIKVSNKKEDLEIFLKSNRKNKVIFSTYQSGKILARNIKALNRKIDFAFFDEAHNTATSKNKLSSYLLSDKNIPIRKRLFMTATPKKFVGSNDEIASMDNEEIFGKLVDEITVKDAIEGIGGLKLLNDYQIVTQIVDSEGYIKLLEDNPFVVDRVKLPEEVELKLLSSAITLKKVRKEKNIKNIVSFHGRRNRANAFRKGAKQFDDELNTYYVDGKQSGTERQNILEEFANNAPSLVTNAQCLSEGVNVPSIDAIMFVDPKQSRVDITQAIGRALRKGDKNKGKSYIIVPIVVDKDNPENINEAYQQILMVLRAMSEHDGRIVEYFKLVREGKKPPKNFVEINSEYLPEEFDLEHFTRTVHFKAWDRVAQLGRRPWEQAREYVRTLGLAGYTDWHRFKKTKDAPIDIPFHPDRSYKKEWTDWRDFLGNPTQEEELDYFIKEFLLLSKKKKLNGKPYFPADNEITKSGFTLGSHARSIRNSIKVGVLPQWKKDKLNEELGDLWTEEGTEEWHWNKNYKLYLEWREKNNTPFFPQGKRYKGYLLHKWCQTQTRNIKHLGKWKIKDTKMRQERERKLRKLGFPLPNKLDYDWEQMYKFAKPLITKYKGTIPVNNPETDKPYKLDGKDIRRWVSKQRTRFENGKLEQNRIEKLESNKYWSWNPHADAFKKNLEMLIEYIEKKGKPNPPQDVKYKGINIGVFLTGLRTDKYIERFSPKIRKQLEKLGTNFVPIRKRGAWIYYD
ncbi:DEAD/DEAH box helicase family protein [Gammaproteobacteria bacterium]|nr:DEAD/DEAH box helicase family protein [Gammaproteobacteria bacterium]